MIDFFVEIPAYRTLSQQDQDKVKDLYKQYEDDNKVLEFCTSLANKLNRERHITHLKKDSLISKKFSNSTFDKYIPPSPLLKTAFEAVQKYASDFEKYKAEGTGLILQGNGSVGTGKTHLASAIANYVMNEYFYSVKFGMITDLLHELKKTFNTADDLIEHMSNIELLVIDDLGKEQPTSWTTSVINQIINLRYQSQRPIIVTLEKNVEYLRTIYGEAIPSRLYEMCVLIDMQGNDYRLTL